MKDLIQTWQASHEVVSAKTGTLPIIKEPPNALALVLNLQHVDVKSTLEKLGTATPEEIKAHKGLRTTFVIVKMLYAGFTYIESDTGDKDSKFQKGKAAAVGSKPAASGSKEKLGCFDQGSTEHVLLHCYKIESKKGVYRPSKRLEECIALSPGMVINAMIWGDKIIPTFKEQKEDFLPFQFGLVQMCIKSSSSNASETGRMLDIKKFTSLDSSPSSLRLLKEGALADSVQAAAVLRDRILDGSFISEKNKENLNQKLIEGSFSNSVQVLCLTPQASHGVISMAADGKIKLFLSQPIGDVNAHAINLDFDRKAHSCPEDGSRDEWMAKFFNVAMMMGAVQLVVMIDSYKNKDVMVSELVLDAFARIDVSAMQKKVIASLPSAELLGIFPSEAKKQSILASFEAQGMPNAGKHLYLYPSVTTELDLLIDSRKMTNKRAETGVSSSFAMAHLESTSWKSGHMLHVFFQDKPVLCFVIPVVEGGYFNDKSKRGLDSEVHFADLIKNVEFEEEADEDLTTSSSTAAPAAAVLSTSMDEETIAKTASAEEEAAKPASACGGLKKKQKTAPSQ